MGRPVRVGMAHLMTEPTTQRQAPACVACGVHLERREHPLPARAGMGTWWDHPPLPTPGFVGHTVSHLDPSPQLRELLRVQAARAGAPAELALPVTLA